MLNETGTTGHYTMWAGDPSGPRGAVTGQYIAPVPQGWECPRCRMVNAPTVSQCECEPPSLRSAPLPVPQPNPFVPGINPFNLDGPT